MPQDPAHAPSPSAPPANGNGEAEAAPSRGSSLGAGTYFLGRYRVVDEIGVGGMASVHLARMDGPGGFQKWVAIKRIHPHLVEDESFVNMFLDEARIAARISHPNVATVFELGKHENTYWIAMEYLHGEPLREVMRRTEELTQPMAPEIACRVIADAAEGLHAAHELLGKNGEKLGLVHRDVSPHNLFVTYDGSTKVVDFGIAKFSSRMANTRAGTLKGKLAYMSPEQVAGEPIDRRSDVFALGVVLWELTSGQRLFRMDNDLDTLAKVQECNVPRPSTIVRGYPIDLEKIVMKALAKTKNERYRTARELSRALQSLLMRRGLFMGSDEISAYMQSVFGDRIQKREAHLRWAAEVTRTIDVDRLKGIPASPWETGEQSDGSFDDEHSRPSSPRSIPRPAAGAPAPSSAATLPPATEPPLPTVPSFKPTLRMGAVATTTVPPPARTPSIAELAPLPVHERSEDAPTLARPRTPPMSEAIPGIPMVYGPDFGDDFEDVGDTVVTNTAPDMDDAPHGPLPAAGRPAMGMPAAAPPAAGGPLGITLTQAQSPGAKAGQGLRRVVSGVPPAPLPVALPHADLPPPNALPGENTRTAPPPNPVQAFPQPLLRSSMSNEFHPPMGQPSVPGAAAPSEMQQLFAPPSRPEKATVTAPPTKKRVPVWVVAVASAVLGLVAFGVVLTLLTRLDATQAPKHPPVTPAGPGVAPTSVAAPFRSARAAFEAIVGAAPTPGMASPGAVTPGESVSADAPAGNPGPLVPGTVLQSSRGWAGVRSAPSAAPSAPAVPTGSLRIVCTPVCDQVIDNGNSLGPSPITNRTASIGSHRIKLAWGDALKVISTVVVADQTATVHETRP